MKYSKEGYQILLQELGQKKFDHLITSNVLDQRMVNQGLAFAVLSLLSLFYVTISGMEKAYTSEIRNLKKEVAQLHENINTSNQITKESLEKVAVETILNKESLAEFHSWLTAPPKKGTVELPEVFRLSLAPYPLFTSIQKD